MAGLEDVARSDAQFSVVVTHGAVLQLVFRRVLGLPLPTYHCIGQHTGTLNELRRAETGWTVQLLDSAWHLDVSDAGLEFPDA